MVVLPSNLVPSVSKVMMSDSCALGSQEGSSREGSKQPQSNARLFHVQGTNEFNIRATEMPARCASLNSNDVFVLKTDICCYLWYGKVRQPSLSVDVHIYGNHILRKWNHYRKCAPSYLTAFWMT